MNAKLASTECGEGNIEYSGAIADMGYLLWVLCVLCRTGEDFPVMVKAPTHHSENDSPKEAKKRVLECIFKRDPWFETHYSNGGIII